MKTYTIPALSQSSTSAVSAGGVIGSTAIRPLINYLLFGFRTNPNTTDQQVRCTLASIDGTTSGTSTASTPLPDDPQDVAAVSTGKITYTVEPTVINTSPFLDFDLNQRASKEWGCQDGREKAGAAAANKGIVSRMAGVTAALQMSCVMGWRE